MIHKIKHLEKEKKIEKQKIKLQSKKLKKKEQEQKTSTSHDSDMQKILIVVGALHSLLDNCMFLARAAVPLKKNSYALPSDLFSSADETLTGIQMKHKLAQAKFNQEKRISFNHEDFVSDIPPNNMNPFNQKSRRCNHLFFLQNIAKRCVGI